MGQTYTLAQYESLKAAIAEGVLSTQYQDKRTVYRSLEEMRQILRAMETDLGIGANPGGSIRSMHVRTSKGL